MISEHLSEDTTKRPNIYLGSVESCSHEQFRGSVVPRTDIGNIFLILAQYLR
jgi:hypothetical protein